MFTTILTLRQVVVRKEGEALEFTSETRNKLSDDKSDSFKQKTNFS